MATTLPGIEQAATRHGLDAVTVGFPQHNTISFEDSSGRFIVLHKLASEEWRVDVYRSLELFHAGFGPGKRAVYQPVDSSALLQAALTLAELEPIVNLDPPDEVYQ